jgi:hypothetical protein
MVDVSALLGHMLEFYEAGDDLRRFYAYVHKAAEGWDGTRPLRRLRACLSPPDWRLVDHPTSETAPPGATFFQYAFRPREFEALLNRAGFEVRARQGYAILWGLLELPFFGAILAKLQRRRAAMARQPAARDVLKYGPAPAAPAPAAKASVSKRFLVSEDATLPVLGIFVRVLRWFAANMMMYVCVARRREGAEAK